MKQKSQVMISYSIFRKKLKKRKKIVSFIIIVQLLSACLSVVIPYINGKFIDSLVIYKDAIIIVRYAFLIGTIGLVSSVLSYIYVLKKVKLKNNISFEINLEGIHQIQKMPLDYTFDPMYMTHRINIDSTSIVSFFIDQVITAAINAIGLLLLLIILFSINRLVFLLVIVFSMIFIALYLLMKKPLFDANVCYKEQQNIFFGKLSEQLILHQEVATHGIINSFSNLIKNSYNAFFQSVYRWCKTNTTFETIDRIIEIAFQVAVVIIGGLQVIRGNITVGEYAVINIYFASIISLIKSYINMGKEYQEVKACAVRMDEIFALKPDQCGLNIIESINRIQVENLSVRNLFSANNAFEKDLFYVIIGQNGAGKTSLIKGIMGLIESDKGNVLFNNKNIKSINLEKARNNKFSVMIQNESAPQMDVGEYLCFMLSMESKEEIEAIIKDRELSNLFLSDHFNLLYLWKKNILSLSEGEKQMVFFLRTVLKEASVYIFDEPTASLSGDLIPEIIKTIKSKKDNHCIVIAISHDDLIIKPEIHL